MQNCVKFTELEWSQPRFSMIFHCFWRRDSTPGYMVPKRANRYPKILLGGKWTSRIRIWRSRVAVVTFTHLISTEQIRICFGLSSEPRKVRIFYQSLNGSFWCDFCDIWGRLWSACPHRMWNWGLWRHFCLRDFGLSNPVFLAKLGPSATARAKAIPPSSGTVIIESSMVDYPLHACLQSRKLVNVAACLLFPRKTRVLDPWIDFGPRRARRSNRHCKIVWNLPNWNVPK